MQRFKNILYILDPFNDTEYLTATKVQSLARLNNAHVSLVSIFEETFSAQMSKMISPQLQDLTQLARQHLQNRLDDFISRTEWSGIAVSSSVLEGKDFIVVIQNILRHNHDLVIKSGTDSNGTDQLAMRLFRKCPCPVWVMRHSHESSKRILAALDLESNRQENINLNRKIIELAHSLAEREKKEVHYLHALYLEYEAMMRSPRFDLGDKEIQAMIEEMRHNSQKTLDHLFQEIGISVPRENIHLPQGDTSTVINRAIDELAIDILIMGTVARSGVPGLLIGNKAEKVLSTITCTVLAAKPEGFISPVNI